MVDRVLADVQIGAVCENSLCAQAFLQLLKIMRMMLLQDAVMFPIDQCNIAFFSHELFQDPELLAVLHFLAKISMVRPSKRQGNSSDLTKKRNITSRRSPVANSRIMLQNLAAIHYIRRTEPKIASLRSPQVIVESDDPASPELWGPFSLITESVGSFGTQKPLEWFMRTDLEPRISALTLLNAL
ncbi:uncharacterized protein BYT42DRAFT_645541 [Radiomyces spectabilis]|uniref:uncharacterized protein n=1 Tax=Radiomyces spectabilis TaxID=64574 RepID=UPI00221E8595|nr:uncharacterized protein BYT42DRAFT_645541 [Radiomyces spectabilis]KAI8378020.1 hypothetical protein BYT42DRAFT_645541 [Radiomyces spectabilis]